MIIQDERICPFCKSINKKQNPVVKITLEDGRKTIGCIVCGLIATPNTNIPPMV